MINKFIKDIMVTYHKQKGIFNETNRKRVKSV